MSDKVFVDTNLLIYLYSIDEPQKRKTVVTLFEESSNLVISTQVLNEFVNVMYRKKKLALSNVIQAIDEILVACELVIIDEKTIKSAIDLHHGQKIEKVLELINPLV